MATKRTTKEQQLFAAARPAPSPVEDATFRLGYAENQAKYRAADFTKKIARVQEDLTRMAEDIGKVAERPTDPDLDSRWADMRTYAYAAQQTVHTIMWGVANLNLDSVVREAVAADAAIRELGAARDALAALQAPDYTAFLQAAVLGSVGKDWA